MSRWSSGVLSATLVFAVFASGCGNEARDVGSRTEPAVAPSTTAPESTTAPASVDPALVQFATAADLVCFAAAQRFQSLPDPDGPGNGAKPLGVGKFMRDMTAELRSIEAPASTARHWKMGLALLDRAANKLIESESAAAAGNVDRASELQGQALWGLEAEAQEHFAAMKAPFRACFVE